MHLGNNLLKNRNVIDNAKKQCNVPVTVSVCFPVTSNALQYCE